MTSPADRPIAVYRINLAAFWVSLFIGLLLQISLPLTIPLARLFDFPLVLTIYYASVRRSKIYGIALGTGLGLAQDALARGLIGISGMSDCVIGYLAAAASIKVNLEQLGARYVLTAALVCVHVLIVAALRLALLETPASFAPMDLAATVAVNVGLALICYPILDFFKHPV